MSAITRSLALPLRIAAFALLIPFAVTLVILFQIDNLPRWSIPVIGAGAGLLGATVVWYLLRPLSKLAEFCVRLDPDQSLDRPAHAATPELNAIYTAIELLTNRYQFERQNHQAVLDMIVSCLNSINQNKPLPHLPDANSDSDRVQLLKSHFHEISDKIQKTRARLAKFTQFLQELPVGLVAVEKNGAIRYANSAAEVILGRQGQELTQLCLKDLLSDTAFTDPLGRSVLTQASFLEWLNAPQAANESVCTVKTKDGPRIIAIRSVTFPGQLTYLLLRNLADEYTQLGMDRAAAREQTIRAVLGEAIQSLSGPLQGIISCSRLLAGEIKQVNNKEVLVGRAKAIRQQAMVANVYLRIVEYLSRSRWGKLPEPMVTEFAAVEPARSAVDTLTPLMRDRDVTAVINDYESGYVCGDSGWIEIALLGVLYHAVWAAKGRVVGISVSRRPRLDDQLEDLIVYECLDIGPALTDAQCQDLELPYGSYQPPSYFSNSDNEGFLPGLMLAKEICRRLGGKAEWKTTPNGSLAGYLCIPTRQPFSCATLPVGELVEVGPLEELVMGWELAHA